MEAMRIVMSGMWLEDAGSLSSGNSRLLMFFVAMVAVALVAQAFALIAMAVGAAKTRKRALEIFEQIHAKMLPMLENYHGFIQETGPKVKIITDNLVEVSHVVRAKAMEFDATASDLNSKTRAQMNRVDGMVTSVLDTTSDISQTVQRGIKMPVREFSGLMNGLKAGLDVLVGRAKGPGRNSRRGTDPGW
jgi:hypothetical protein